ncbi:MAG: hypothetical protein IT435_17810 [Phycisphaerales bacterium]|nr:hypothetical protein [Phycisphaerales bacterium]
MPHDHTSLEKLLDSHAGVGVESTPPPAKFMAAVRRRRHTRRAVQAGATLAILAVVASAMLMVVNRPRLVATPAGDPLAGASQSRIGFDALQISPAGTPLDSHERALLRPGADPGSEEVRLFLESI